MSEPSGDPVEQLAARQAGVAPTSEFYAPPPPPSLGDPATDSPFTWRRHPDDRPLDLDARRVLRVDDWAAPTGGTWLVVSGPRVGEQLAHDAVRTWPYTSHLHADAAVGLAARRAGEVTPSGRVEPVGDMDVDAFKPRRDG